MESEAMEGPWERDEPILSGLKDYVPTVDARFDHVTAASGVVEYHYDTDDGGVNSFMGDKYYAKTSSHGNTWGKADPKAAEAILKNKNWAKLIGHPEQKILYTMEQEIMTQEDHFDSVTLHLYSTQGLCPACKKALSVTRSKLRQAKILFDVKLYYGHFNEASSYGWKGDPSIRGSRFHYLMN